MYPRHLFYKAPRLSTAEVSADLFDDAGISEEENNWPWRAVPRPSEPTSGRLVPWAHTWPPSWWPCPLLKGLRGSVRKVQKDQHSKCLGAKEAVHTVKAALRGADDVRSFSSSGAGLGHVTDCAAGLLQGRCLKVVTPRPGRFVGIGDDRARHDRALLLENSLSTEKDFPEPSTTTVSKVMVLNWNAGNLVRNSSLIDFICGPFSLCLLQESSTTLGQVLAESRGICWSDSPDGQEGCLSVLAGAAGRKVVSPTYGLDFSGQIFRPFKDEWKKGERIHAACMYTVDVTWFNENGELVQRAGLDSWRVTSFHMDHVEAKSGANGSGGKTLASVFGLAMRDQHRVLAGDFNAAQRYVCPTLNKLIEGQKDFAGITYQYLESPLSSEIGIVIFNYPGTVQLTGEVKFGRFGKDSKFWQALGLRSTDKDAHYPQVVMIYEKGVVGSLASEGGRKLCHKRSFEGQRNQNRKKRKRRKNVSAPGHDTADTITSNDRECSDLPESKVTISANSVGPIRFVPATDASGSGSGPLAFSDGRSCILADSLQFMFQFDSDSSDDDNDMQFE